MTVGKQTRHVRTKLRLKRVVDAVRLQSLDLTSKLRRKRHVLFGSCASCGTWKQVWPVYRVLDEDGRVRADAVEPDLSKDLALKMYGNMIRLEAMDDIFYNAQRQVRTSTELSGRRHRL